MANPQCENGYTKIANELLDALIRTVLSPNESRILWFIIRKTYGFGKKFDKISFSQFSKSLDLDRSNVHRTITRLKERNIIVVRNQGAGQTSEYGIQKDYDRWQVLSLATTDKGVGVVSSDNKVLSAATTKVLSVQPPTKEKKENIQNMSTEVQSTCPHQAIVDLYHEVLPELRKVRIWSEERQAHLRARWNSGHTLADGTKSNSLAYWRRFFEFVRQSDFLMGNVSGRNGQRAWRADLEWLVRKSNFIKVVERKYHAD